MASIRKRGNSYLIVVSMGYDHTGKRIKPQPETITFTSRQYCKVETRDYDERELTQDDYIFRRWSRCCDSSRTVGTLAGIYDAGYLHPLLRKKKRK